MKKGFTLIELLAVIVILSVIAIITVPIIGNVIEESKKKALEQGAYGLVSAADYYAIKYEGEHGFEFENGKQISSDKLDYKGTIQGTGKLYIDNNGDVSLCINTDKYYVIKNYNSGIEIKEKQEYGCNIEQDPLTNKYVAYLDNGENGPISVYTKSESDERYVLKSDLASYTTKEYVDTQDNVLSGIIGTLKNLNVSEANKGNLVSAINEINNNLPILSFGTVANYGAFDTATNGSTDYTNVNIIPIISTPTADLVRINAIFRVASAGTSTFTKTGLSYRDIIMLSGGTYSIKNAQSQGEYAYSDIVNFGYANNNLVFNITTDCNLTNSMHIYMGLALVIK